MDPFCALALFPCISVDPTMSICAGCGSEAAPHLCSRCQKARYCSRPCQTGHWKQHKRECKAPAPSSEAKEGRSGSAGSGHALSRAPSAHSRGPIACALTLLSAECV